jgi:putative DNA primase/helicase
VLHRREDLLTNLAPVVFDPSAPCPTWERFLDRTMDGNADKIAFLQRAAGYSLTGITPFLIEIQRMMLAE